jgi:hypothetical protein
MPSFRDLKGREVEDVVDSRTFPTATQPDAGGAMVERAEIKAAMEKAAANRPHRRERSDGDRLRDRVLVLPEDARFVPDPQSPLPEDFASGLAALEATLDTLDALADEVADATRRAREQMAALRARAQQDADKVAKFSAALKLLQQADT